ncbi:unnamed protein product [Cochlearia groenlandica]
MGKGRVPCCDKGKVKRGPWSPQEDLTLITFIQKHGHLNWRSLPKLAGLMRCGKSCRLRWINYLRPDVKRGNFTKEEEDSIIHFHQTLGNKFVVKIASFLPGRTDNEIKNVWNTHLKKRLLLSPSSSSSSSSISCTHDDQPLKVDDNEHKNCSIVQEEGISKESQDDSPSSSSSHLHEIKLLLDHEDFDDITSTFLQSKEFLYLDHDQHLDSHISTELVHDTCRATQDVICDQQNIPCRLFEETNIEYDLWSKLVESNLPTLTPNSSEDFNEWLNFMDNQTYFDDFTLVGEICL